MDLERLRTMRMAGAAPTVARLAAAAVQMALTDSRTKPLIVYGGRGQVGQDKLDLMARFVRENVTAPTEALFLHTGARGVHAGLEAGYLAADFADRLGLETFRNVLLHMDQALEAEEARLEAEARAAAAVEKGPIPAAALSIDQEDTILEQLEDPLAVHKDRVLAEVKSDAQTAPVDGPAAPDAPDVAGAQLAVSAGTLVPAAANDGAAPSDVAAAPEAAPKPAVAPLADVPAAPGGQGAEPLPGAGAEPAAPEWKSETTAPGDVTAYADAVKADSEAHAQLEVETGITVTPAQPAPAPETTAADPA